MMNTIHIILLYPVSALTVYQPSQAFMSQTTKPEWAHTHRHTDAYADQTAVGLAPSNSTAQHFFFLTQRYPRGKKSHGVGGEGRGGGGGMLSVHSSGFIVCVFSEYI